MINGRLVGSKPDFHSSMKTADANEMYKKFLDKLGAAYKPEKIKGKKGL